MVPASGMNRCDDELTPCSLIRGSRCACCWQLRPLRLCQLAPLGAVGALVPLITARVNRRTWSRVLVDVQRHHGRTLDRFHDKGRAHLQKLDGADQSLVEVVVAGHVAADYFKHVVEVAA